LSRTRRPLHVMLSAPPSVVGVSRTSYTTPEISSCFRSSASAGPAIPAPMMMTYNQPGTHEMVPWSVPYSCSNGQMNPRSRKALHVSSKDAKLIGSTYAGSWWLALKKSSPRNCDAV
jgi:hypothetical protein